MAVSKVLSIEISDYVTRVALISYNKKKTKIKKTLTFLNPEGTVDDGFVVDRKIYGPYLKKQLANAKLRCKDVVFVIQSSKVMSRETNVTDIKEKELNAYLYENRDDFFPMNTSEYVFKYSLLEKNKGDKTIRIMIYAAHELLIKSFIGLCRDYGFKLQALDFSGNAVYQWQKEQWQRAKDHDDDFKIYLQINDASSVLTILDDGMLSLQRNMAFGAEAFTDSIIRSGLYGELDYQDALKVLGEEELLYKTFTEMEQQEPATDEEFAKYNLRSSLSGHVRQLIENIARVLEFYNSKHRDARVGKILVGGPGSRVLNLIELLQSELPGIEIEAVKGLPGVKFAGSKKNDLSVEGSDFTAQAGAANETLNFYDGKEKKAFSIKVALAVFGVILVALASGLIVINGKVVYDQAVEERDKVKAELDAEVATYSDAMKIEAGEMLEELQNLITFDESTFRHNELFTKALAEIEEYAVQDMVVSSLSSSESGLSMNVTVHSKAEAAKIIQQLRSISYFDRVEVYSIAEIVDETTKLTNVSFTIRCVYTGSEEETEDATENSDVQTILDQLLNGQGN